MIFKTLFLNISGAKSLKRSIREKRNMQNIFEKSLHLGVTQASIYYAEVQVAQTAMFHIPLTLETSFLHQKIKKV